MHQVHYLMLAHVSIFLLTAACKELTKSAACLAAFDLLQTTAKTIVEETITVAEVRVITIEPHAQQNLEHMLAFQPEDPKVVKKKLHNAKLQLTRFEIERSQLLRLNTRWQRHIAEKDQSEVYVLSEPCCVAIACKAQLKT